MGIQVFERSEIDGTTGLPTDWVLAGLAGFLIKRPAASFTPNWSYNKDGYFIFHKKKYFVNDLSLYLPYYQIIDAINFFVDGSAVRRPNADSN